MTGFADDVRVLLAPVAEPAALRRAARSLRDGFAALTGIGDAPGTATALPSGHAISSEDAARCFDDELRSSRFLRGVRDAIDETRRAFPGERVRVLYAGCGPWAPLVLPLCTVFTPDEVEFVLVDVHERSVVAVRRLVEGLDLRSHSIEVRQGDATSLRLDDPVHVAVAEILQQALSHEPQVAVTANLAPQLREGGVLVPRRIRVDAVALDLARAFPETSAAELAAEGTADQARARVDIGPVLDLTAGTVGSWMAKASDGHLPGVVHRVPELPAGADFHAALDTSIQIHGALRLDGDDSGLTRPKILHEIGRLHQGQRIRFRYRLGPDPGFEASIDPAHPVEED